MWFSPFIPLLLVGVGYAIYKICIQTWKNDLQQKIHWLTSSDLFFRICDIQNNIDAPHYCKITLENEDFARDILKHFAQQRLNDFVGEKLPYNHRTAKMTNDCYFMHSLYAFLSNQDFGRKFLNHDLFHVIEHKELQGTATWGGKRWEETCELTPFGNVFCKLHFLSMRYCEIYSSSALHDSETIKQSLLSGKIFFKKL